MNLLVEIFLAAAEILTLVVGLSGVSLSLLLLFYPDMVRRLGVKLNASVTLIPISPLLDRKIETNRLAYRYPNVVGAVFIVASVFVLHFLFFGLSPNAAQTLFGELFFDSLATICKFGALSGVLLGAALLTAPKKVRALEDRLGTWIDTQDIVYDLDRPRPHVDHILLRFPRISGAAGLLASFMLTVLSVYNLAR